MTLLFYCIIFLLFSIIGWLYEHIFFGLNHYDGVSKKIGDNLGVSNVMLPILPLYGVAGVGITFINTLNMSLLSRIIIASLFVNILECLMGLLSLQFYGYQTWHYQQLSTCHGYVSLYAGMWWTILVSIYMTVFGRT